MSRETNSEYSATDQSERAFESSTANIAKPDLKDPRVVLSLLEADQVVAAKRMTHFGQRNFSPGLRIALWGLRVYVVVMFVIVLFSVIQALYASP
ncbi:MAG TPA: hypothetical protein VEG64_16305 [Candidatus Sulfotelmatobacter sp.]|nr:hypothetical protein [Candidatus Sulfotelmatobacter sp.]